MSSDIIKRFKEHKLTDTFILYVDEECEENESEVVCNSTCMHCYHRFSSRRMKTLESMKAEVDTMIERGANHVQITGGEPTLHSDFIELINYIKSKDVMCSSITNGFLLANELFVEKIKGNIDYFLMSIHGGNDETWSKITNVKNAWKKTVQALDNLTNSGIEVHVNFTVMKPNYKQIPELVEFLSGYSNVKRFNMITFNPWCSFQSDEGEKAAKSLIVSYDDMMEYIQKGVKIAFDSNIDIALRYFPFCKTPENLRKYNFNYVTSIFDMNEWNREYWMPDEFDNVKRLYEIAEKFRIEGSIQQRLQHVFSKTFYGFKSHFKKIQECKKCSHLFICDMPHIEQVEYFPGQKFESLKGPIIRDASFYLKSENEE